MVTLGRVMLLQWLVYPHFRRLAPAADGTSSARWIGLASSLNDHCSLLANGLGGSAVALVERHKFDAAVAVLVVVPINERHHPFAGLLLAGKGPAGVIRPVFDRTEHGFRINFIDENLGLKKSLSTTSSSIRTSRAATRIALPLSAWRISG